jgi:hypothetical protein
MFGIVSSFFPKPWRPATNQVVCQFRLGTQALRQPPVTTARLQDRVWEPQETGSRGVRCATASNQVLADPAMGGAWPDALTGVNA